jgi:membrane-associated phospholipid phosphatase
MYLKLIKNKILNFKIKLYLVLSLLFILVNSVLYCMYNDNIILWHINNWHTPFLDRFFSACSAFGRGDIIAIYFIVFFVFIKNLRNKFYIFSSAFFGAVTGFTIWGLKVYFNRPRPLSVFSSALHTVPWLDSAFEYSMPSGHTAGGFSIGIFIILCFNKYLPTYASVILFLMAASCGISRIYLAQHYMSDVIVGAILGLALGFISFIILKKLNFITLQIANK